MSEKSSRSGLKTSFPANNMRFVHFVFDLYGSLPGSDLGKQPFLYK